MCDVIDYGWAVLVGSVALLIVALGVAAVIGAVRESRRPLVHLDDRELAALAPWLAGATGSTSVEWSRTLVEGLVEQLNNGRRAR
jgi:hypothetical protein